MKTGFQSQPAKQPLKPVFTLKNGYARNANEFLQDDTFQFIFSFEFLYPRKCHASTENNLFRFVHPNH